MTNASEIVLLQYLLNMISVQNSVLHLYVNDVTPSETTLIGGLTEATDIDYAPVTMPGTNWTTTQVSGVTTGVYSEQTFNFNTVNSVYGYYVTNTSNQLLWVERFPGAPFVLPDDGGQIVVGPRITLD